MMNESVEILDAAYIAAILSVQCIYMDLNTYDYVNLKACGVYGSSNFKVEISSLINNNVCVMYLTKF